MTRFRWLLALPVRGIGWLALGLADVGYAVGTVLAGAAAAIEGARLRPGARPRDGP